jgi:hypothetical protein
MYLDREREMYLDTERDIGSGMHMYMYLDRERDIGSSSLPPSLSFTLQCGDGRHGGS